MVNEISVMFKICLFSQYMDLELKTESITAQDTLTVETNQTSNLHRQFESLQNQIN